MNYTQEICDNIELYENEQIKVQQYVSELQTYNKILQVSIFCICIFGCHLGNRIITLHNTEKNATIHRATPISILLCTTQYYYSAAAFPVSSFFDWSISFLIHHRPYLLAYIPYLPVLGRIVTDGRLSSFARLSDTFSTTLYSSSIRISGMSSKLNICFLNACKVSNMHFMIIVEGFSFRIITTVRYFNFMALRILPKFSLVTELMHNILYVNPLTSFQCANFRLHRRLCLFLLGMLLIHR